jgi:general secretion pathway protein D
VQSSIIRQAHILAAVLLSCVIFSAAAGIGRPPVAAAAAQPASVTFVANDEPLRDALLRLGKQLGLNIVVAAQVQGRVTATLHGATVSQALTALLVPLGYSYHVIGGVVIVDSPRSRHSPASAAPAVQIVPTVLNVSTIPVDRAYSVLHELFPRAHITADRAANALIAVATPDDIGAMRSVLTGIDVQDPTRRTTEAIQLHLVDPRSIAAKLQSMYTGAKVTAGPNRTLIVEAAPLDMNQIKSIVASMDSPTATPAPTTAPAEAVRLVQAQPSDVARAITHEFPGVRAAVVGSSVVVSGSSDDVARAKALIGLIDQPSANTRFTQVYRLHDVDAKSVGDLIARSFRNAIVTVDVDLNALSVTATASDQRLIADGVAQLDVAPGGSAPNGAGAQQPGNAVNTGFAPGGSGIEVITLKSAIPGQNLAPSTSASDIAAAVSSALQPSAPDLHITVPNNSTQLVLTGSPYSIRLAKQLIDQLDVSPPQIVLDTEVLELDETGQKNVGLLLPTALSATYSEIQPFNPNGTPPPVLGIQPWTRTTISAQVVLNALMTKGHARVLADPRITTISGHTASIRAGDTINYTTSVVNGNVGSVVTQQVQSVQTGVTLDITPVVNANNSISVTLHPTVNSLLGTNSQGVPSIANREAQTTVTLGDNQTLVIGGLIQENASRNETSVPFLGDIPLIGRLFRSYSVNTIRNELIIVVTPHILGPGGQNVIPEPALPAIPSPEPLPTLPSGTTLPVPKATSAPVGSALSTPLPLAAAVPIPTPTAFAHANEFRYGSAPTNTYAGSGDPPQIFYALFSPTVLHNGAQTTVSVITTTNIARVTLGYGGYVTTLAPVGPDKWQAAFVFNAGGFSFGAPSVSLALTAYRGDGASAVIQIPVSITP